MTPKYPLGTGRVGLDIGPQTLAAVGYKHISMNELAPHANQPFAALRRVNRAMDRSRRATNPDFFNEDGTIVPINKISSERKNKNGKRDWKQSSRYKRLADERRYLYAKTARTRRIEHNKLANQILQYGDRKIKNHFHPEQHGCPKNCCISFLLKTFCLHIDGSMFPYFVPISFVER